MLTPQDYRDALEVQNACNLSGIVRSFSRATEKLWAEARARGEGTEFVNRHPISVLYAAKLANLSGADRAAGFAEAWGECDLHASHAAA